MLNAYPVPFFFLISIETSWWILSLVNKWERYNLSVSDTGGFEETIRVLYSQQESNLWPTHGYYTAAMLYHWASGNSKELRTLNYLRSCDKCSTTVKSTRIFSSKPSVSLNKNHLALPYFMLHSNVGHKFFFFNFCKETILLHPMLTVWLLTAFKLKHIKRRASKIELHIKWTSLCGLKSMRSEISLLIRCGQKPVQLKYLEAYMRRLYFISRPRKPICRIGTISSPS